METLKLTLIQENLLETLRKNGPLSRSQMVNILGIPRTTIYDNLVGLMENDLVKRFSRQINSKGRPVVFFKLKED